MSSFFDKLKVFVNARVRGPQRYQKLREGRRQMAGEPPPPPTDAVGSTTNSSVSEIQESAGVEEQTNGLEEERVVDLLKGEES
jgi:hypothetical protein